MNITERLGTARCTDVDDDDADDDDDGNEDNDNYVDDGKTFVAVACEVDEPRESLPANRQLHVR